MVCLTFSITFKAHLLTYKQILTTVVDGKTTARQRTGSSALNLYPGCKGEDFGNGIKMFVCTNNPFNIVGGGYCEYNGQRFDFEERGAPTDTCQNVFPQYGPYSEASALQYSAGADF